MEGQILEALQGIRSELASLHGRLDALEAKVGEGQELVAIAADTADTRIDALRARGIDPEARALQLVQIAEAVTEPELLERVHGLASRTQELSILLQSIGELPGLVATLVDAGDTTITAMQARGVDLDARLHALTRAAEHLSSPAALRTLEALFGDGQPDLHAAPEATLDSAVLQLLVDTAEAISEARQAPLTRAGLFGLFRAVNDADVQAASSFAIAFARALGSRLRAAQKQLT